MAFTTEAIAVEASPANPTANNMVQDPLNLPTKTFSSFDPKSIKTVAGNDKNPQPPDPKQASVAVDAVAEESVMLSPKVSAMARKEQAARQREQALIKREKELEAKLADAEKFAQLKAKIAAKDYSAADELGLKYDDLVQHELNKESSKDPAELRARKMEEEIQSLRKTLEEREIQEAIDNDNLWKAEISKFTGENEEYYLIKEQKAEDAVFQHIKDSFNEDGVELTVEQAAKEINDALVERAERYASYFERKNKVSAAKVLGPPKTATTITQNMTTTPLKHKSTPFHLLSESEQLAEAIRRVQAEKLKR